MMARPFIVLLLAAWMAAAGATPARADPLTSAVAAFVSFLGSGTIAATITQLAIGVGLSYLSQALGKKSATSQIGGIDGTLGSGDTVPHSIVIGRGVADASLVYANTYGSDGGTPNAKLVQVIELANLPGHDLAEIWLNGEKLTWDADATPETEGIAIPEYTSGEQAHLWVRYYDGTQTTADSRLVSLFGSDTDRPYQSTRKGRGICYVVVTALIDEKLFSGFPQFTFVLDGVPLYDRRADSTAGGDGDQRADTASTWARSSNPIVAVENLIRGLHYPDGSWAYGAQTAGAGQLPSASWFAAANECDSAITLAVGGTEPQFAAGGCVRFSDAPADVIEELLKACNGRLAEIGGIYKVRAGAPGSAIFTFTDADILSTEAQTFAPFPSLADTVNAVTAKYISPAEGWAEKDAPPLYSTDLEAADGGRRQAADVRYGFVSSGSQVQRLMRAERDTHRAFRTHALPMPFEAFVVEPLDVVAFGSDRNGYDIDKAFEVQAVDDLPDLTVNINIREIDPDAYDWDSASDEVTIVNGPLARIATPSQAMADWTVAGITVAGDNNRARAGLRLSWNASVEDVDGIQFQVRRASDAILVLSGESDGWDLGQIDITQNIISATNYEARGRYRPISARDTTWSSWLAATTPDVGIGAGELDAALNSLLDQLRASAQASLAAAIDEIRAQIEQLAADNGGAYAVAEKLRNAIISGVGERVGENEARVTVLQQAQADLETALALFFVDLLATTEGGTAEAQFQVSAMSTLPDGAISAAELAVRAGVGGEIAEAAIRLAAYAADGGGYKSRIQMIADQADVVDSYGNVLPLNAVAISGAALEVPIAGGEITVDYKTRRKLYRTVVDGDAVYRYPTLPEGYGAGVEFDHDLVMDGAGGHSVTFDDDELFGSAPTIDSTALMDNLIRVRIKNISPPKMRVTLEDKTPEDPSFSFLGAKLSNRSIIPITQGGGQAGEVMVVIGASTWGFSTGGANTVLSPAGWTPLFNVTGVDSGVDIARLAGWMRRLDGSETSSVAFFGTQTTGGGGVSFARTLCMRFSGGVSLANGNWTTQDAARGDPTAQTVSLSGIASAPVIAFAAATGVKFSSGNSGAQVDSLSLTGGAGATDFDTGNYTPVTAGDAMRDISFRVQMEIFNSGPLSDLTADAADTAAVNAAFGHLLASGYIKG